MKSILITGGVRSGKSSFAQQTAEGLSQRVLFVATAEAGDDEMARRIAAHRKKRPRGWRTLEVASGVAEAIRGNRDSEDVVLLDCVTLLVSNVMGRCGESDPAEVQSAVDSEINGLISYMEDVPGTCILVTNEVGLGIVPENAMARLYRDLLGRANQMLARCSRDVYLMVAGIPVRIKPAAGQSGAAQFGGA